MIKVCRFFCNSKPTLQEFSQLDFRIGQIMECWKHPESQNLYCEKVKLMDDPLIMRNIGSGLQKFIPIEQMLGKVLVLKNLKTRKLAGFQSEGMLMCASNKEKTAIQLLKVEGQVGQRIYIEGEQQKFKGEEKTLNPKKKLLQKCLVGLQTNSEGYVHWEGRKLRTSVGFIKSSIFQGTVS